MSHFAFTVAAAAATLACAGAAAQTPNPAPVTVRGHYDNAVGSSDAASQGVINAELLMT